MNYGQEQLQETEKYEATTVGELVAFMLEYRLMFADSEKPSSTILYGDLYTVMSNQTTALGINLRETPAVNPPMVDVASALFKVGSVWIDTDLSITIIDRNGKHLKPMQKRIVERNAKFGGAWITEKSRGLQRIPLSSKVLPYLP